MMNDRKNCDPPTSQQEATVRMARRTEIETQIIRLKRELNTLTPISMLPSELLVRIFIAYRSQLDWLKTIQPAPGSRTSYHTLIWIAHVCSHWRAVALSCPMLWSVIVLPLQLDLAREMLARSDSTPLSLYVTLNKSTTHIPEQTISFAIDALPRTRSLHITAVSAIHRKFSQMINASAPNLEELTLVGLDAPPLDSVSPSHLPGMVKNIQNARLKHLKLVKHSFRWSSITCFTLTHLTIIRYGLRAEYGCSARDVLDALRRLPLLCNLELEQVVFVSPRSNSMPIQTAVCLRYLRSVRIEADVTVCTTFLNYLSLPALSTLMLHVDSLSSEEEIAELTSCLATRVPFWKGIHTLRLSREGDFGTPMRIHALSEMEREGEHSDGIRRLSSLPYEVGITYFVSLGSLHGEEEQICHFIRGLPLATVRELDVAGIYFDEKEEWFTSFEPLNGVTLLRVSCPSNAPPLPNALGQCVSAHSNGSDKSSTLFPYLRVLTLHEACFKDPSLINEYEFMDSLVTCLKWRRERNAGLQELRLTECYNIGASIVEDLRTIVPSVDWDSRVLSVPEADQEALWDPDEDWD